ncbi:MAG: 30S ribosomal protein S18 [Candidatus Cloacimonetes bacterium]|nr:30S ribosomal protein S18 [Candidatus Cloacimonadota bacterium]
MRSRSKDSNKKFRKKFSFKKKFCRFCKDTSLEIDYKKIHIIQKSLMDNGKILPRRISGTCTKHQRKLSREVKRARQMALIPYSD